MENANKKLDSPLSIPRVFSRSFIATFVFVDVDLRFSLFTWTCTNATGSKPTRKRRGWNKQGDRSFVCAKSNKKTSNVSLAAK